MTDIAKWAYVTPLTLWESTVDLFGQASFVKAYTINGTYAAGTDAVSDPSGIEFVPQSDYWFEDPSPSALPQIGWRIAVGSFNTDVPPSGSEVIRRVATWDSSMLTGGAVRDFRVST